MNYEEKIHELLNQLTQEQMKAVLYYIKGIIRQ